MHKNNKTIICIYGRANEGKSQTIIKITDLLIRNFQISANDLITLYKLAEEKKCSIIICAARTRGETNHKIDEIAKKFDFNTLWLSSFWSPKLNSNTLNNLAAENLLRIIQQLITDGDIYHSQP